MFDSRIDNWNKLMTALEITDENQPEAISKIQEWFQGHIKSSVTIPRLNELKNLFQTYSELNAAPSLSTIVNPELGYTVAHKAAKLGFDRFLDLNLKPLSGETVKKIMDARTVHGNTPLHLAATSGNLAMIQLLIEEYEADADLQNNNNKSALDLAALGEVTTETNQSVSLLLKYTSKKLYTTELLFNLVAFDDHSLMDSVLQANPDLLYSHDERDQNILHKAIIMGSGRLFVHLSNIHPELLDQVTSNDSSVFHLACRYGDNTVLDKIFNETAISDTLSSSQDEHGMTPLHHLEGRTDFEDSVKGSYRSKLLSASSDTSPKQR